MTAVDASTTADVGMLDGASLIAAVEWDSLARRGFHQHNWFVAAERSGWIPRHVAVRRGERLCGIVPAYLTGRNTLHDLHARWLGPLSEVAVLAGIDLRPIISVQAPFAVMSQPLGDPELLPPDLLHRVFDSLEASAVADGAKAVAWPCVDSDAAQLLRVGQERGYTALYAGASARINVEWECFDEYLASRSKNVRRTIRTDLLALRSAGLRVELVNEFRNAVPAMNALCIDAFQRRNPGQAPVHKEFFQELSLRPSAGIRAQLTWSGMQLVGTSMNLMTADLLEGTLSAFSAEHRGGPAYYNDLCYEPIRLACRERIAAIDLGPTALYTKVLRGAALRRRVMLIKGTTAARHLALSTIGRLVANHTMRKEKRMLGPLWSPSLFQEGPGRNLRIKKPVPVQSCRKP